MHEPRPLDDVVVVEAGETIAPAYAGKLLAELGATVIRIDRPCGGRLYRTPPLVGRDDTGLPVSAAYLYLNRGKKSVAIDAGADMGRNAVARLLARADVLVEGMEGLDGYAPLRARHPRLIVTAISPFGLDGPYRDLVASDLVVLALGGLLEMVGFPDREPLRLGGAQVQYAAGLSAFAATMAALLHRDRTGAGQLIDVSCFETVAFVEWKSGAYLDADGRVRKRGSESQWLVLPARDGFVGLVYQDGDWPAVQRLTGLAALGDERFATRAGRTAHLDELRRILAPWSSTRTKTAIYHDGQARGIPLGFVATIADLLDSEQYAARGFWVTEDHPFTGPAAYPGLPYRAGWTPARLGRAPLPGEHTREVLGAVARYADDEIDALRSLGAT